MNGWISVKDNPPPKNDSNPIWVLDSKNKVITTVIWHKGKYDGWFGNFSDFCNCCHGYCQVDFDYWQPIPEGGVV